MKKPRYATQILMTTLLLVAGVSWVPAQAKDKTVYGWECKTESGEVVLNGVHTVPFKGGKVVEATTEPYGKATGLKDAGACSQIRFDLDDGRKAICEPIGIPVVHSFFGGWQYAPIDKSKCKA